MSELRLLSVRRFGRGSRHRRRQQHWRRHGRRFGGQPRRRDRDGRRFVAAAHCRGEFPPVLADRPVRTLCDSQHQHGHVRDKPRLNVRRVMASLVDVRTARLVHHAWYARESTHAFVRVRLVAHRRRVTSSVHTRLFDKQAPDDVLSPHVASNLVAAPVLACHQASDATRPSVRVEIGANHALVACAARNATEFALRGSVRRPVSVLDEVTARISFGARLGVVTYFLGLGVFCRRFSGRQRRQTQRRRRKERRRRRRRRRR